MSRLAVVAWLLWMLGGGAEVLADERHEALRRAVGFLAREVPAWQRDNQCFSCHNNGDAARALYRARQAGWEVPDGALESTSRWLQEPERWEHNGGEGPFNDTLLAAVQFGRALLTAHESQQVRSADALPRAAQLLIGRQEPDGSWRLQQAEVLGSPASYGKLLATVFAEQTLAAVPDAESRQAARNARQFLARQRPATVVDAASLLLQDADQVSVEQRNHCLQVLMRGQAESGAWGPYVTSRGEAFDTALALLAIRQAWQLLPEAEQPAWRTRVERGLDDLVRQQQDDGSWVETTRPPGSVSYAQRISTSGWATLALLAWTEKPQSPAARGSDRGGTF